MNGKTLKQAIKEERAPAAALASGIASVCTCILLTVSASLVHADFYQYKDGKGTVHLTNKLEHVPEKYRQKMKVIPEEKPKPASAAPTRPEQTLPGEVPTLETDRMALKETSAPPGAFSGPFQRLPWLKPLLVICGFFAGFLIMVKIAAMLPSPHLARIVYISFFLCVFVFAYKAYAEHLSTSYLTVKSRILTMFKKANEREGLQPEPTAAAPAGAAVGMDDLK